MEGLWEPQPNSAPSTAHPQSTPNSTRQAELGAPPKPMSGTAGLCLPLPFCLTVPLYLPLHVYACLWLCTPILPSLQCLHWSPAGTLACLHHQDGTLNAGLRTVPTPPPHRIWHIAGTERGSHECLPPREEAPTQVLEKQGEVRRSLGQEFVAVCEWFFFWLLSPYCGVQGQKK